MNTNEVETRLREIAERENKATKGPWEAENWETCVMQSGLSSVPVCVTTRTNPPDALFIAHSRQDVPWLLELIKKQREALVAAEDALKNSYDVQDHQATLDCKAQLALNDVRDALNFSPE